MYDYGVQPHPPAYKLLKGGEELVYDYGVQPHPPLLKGGEELDSPSGSQQEVYGSVICEVS